MLLRFNLFNKRIGIETSIRDKREQSVIGYTNRTEDGLYIVFLDYDNLELQWIRDELKRLQEDFGLSSFYIFQSSESSYHAVCFDKVDLMTYLDILQNSSVDFSYMHVPMKYGRKIWTLRLTDKEKPIKFIEEIARISANEKSNAHIRLINKMFNLKIAWDVYDDDMKIIFARYQV